MASKWFHKKDDAIRLRRSGKSIRYIAAKFGIPKSTLSGWFREITLTSRQKAVLFRKWQRGFVKARKKAVLWHRAMKAERLRIAEEQAKQVLSGLDLSNKDIIDLALAMLYLGEGFKNNETGIGNSDPLILKAFLGMLRINYKIDTAKIGCELHLRADQNPQAMKRYWSKQLHLPISSFKTVTQDMRTKGIPTYPYYKGVCALRCANIAIQRKLLNISKAFCERIAARA